MSVRGRGRRRRVGTFTGAGVALLVIATALTVAVLFAAAVSLITRGVFRTGAIIRGGLSPTPSPAKEQLLNYLLLLSELDTSSVAAK